MGDYIDALITPKGYAKLVIMGEVDLDRGVPKDESKSILREIYKMQVDELLAYVDASVMKGSFDTLEIPQFGKVSMIGRVPDVFEKTGMDVVDYAQLGFYLKNDPSATLMSNTKFGENHGKIATQLGIVSLRECRFYKSALTLGMMEFSEQEKINIIAKLCFRIPILREYLKVSKNGPIDGYSFLSELSDSTKERRGSSIRSLMKCMSLLGDEDLNRRIDNTYWPKLKGEGYDSEIRN